MDIRITHEDGTGGCAVRLSAVTWPVAFYDKMNNYHVSPNTKIPLPLLKPSSVP